MRSFTTILTAALALATSTFAGQVTINNHCGANVYSWVAGDTTSDMITINPGSNFVSKYESRAFGGISVKLSYDTDIYSSQPVAQFEYTSDADTLWYDLSLINGDPFESSHIVITPQSGNGGSCETLDCPAGIADCLMAYLAPNDVQTHSCPAQTDMVVDLCSSASSKRDVLPVARSHARDFSGSS